MHVPEPVDRDARASALRAASPWARTAEPLIWFSGAGREQRGPDYFHDAHARGDAPHVTLQFTLAGRGYYQPRRGERVVLPAGSAFIDVIPGPFTYGFHQHSGELYDLIFVSASGPVAMRWGKRIARTFGHVLRFGEGASPAPLMLEIVRRHADGTLGDRYMVSGMLYQLFMTIFSSLSISRVATEPRIGRAIALIEARATDAHFNVIALADELDCSREYLARRFGAAVGVTPSDYLAQHRLRLAAGALRASDDKLESIARRSGFSNANYLCRMFKKHVGVTPGAFRARTWMAMP
jgi:AraC family transcriptional regulator